LHPKHDDLPQHTIKARGMNTIPIYVPAHEESDARRVLAEWYADSRERVERELSPVRRGLVLFLAPWLALGLLVGVFAADVAAGLGVAGIGPLLTIQFIHIWRQGHDR